jgi:hypothetical protein
MASWHLPRPSLHSASTGIHICNPQNYTNLEHYLLFSSEQKVRLPFLISFGNFLCSTSFAFWCWKKWKLMAEWLSVQVPHRFHCSRGIATPLFSFFLFLVTEHIPGLNLLTSCSPALKYDRKAHSQSLSLYSVIAPRLVAHNVPFMPVLILLPFKLLMSLRNKRS